MVPAVEVFSRYLKLLEAIAGRSTYVALLSQYPKAAERVGRVLAASRWTADYIVRHPIILDELVTRWTTSRPSTGASGRTGCIVRSSRPMAIRSAR